jgi:integrase/recombinase XerD
MLNESKYEQWAKQYKSVQKLFEKLSAKKSGSKATERTYSRSLMLWHEFSSLTPDETVAKWENEAKADLSQALQDWDDKLDAFVNWLVKTKGFTKGVSSGIHASVKSLIKYNSRIKLSIGTPPVGVVESLKPITIEEFKRLYSVANLQQRWILAGLKDSGMSREDFIELTYGDIRADFERGENFIHISAVRRKESVKYDTFLGPNAVEILRTYLEVRKRRGEVISDKSFLTVGDTQPYPQLAINSLTKTLLRVGQRVGISASPHRLRKTFETYMALTVRHPIILKYWMGHKLNVSDVEAKYIIPPVAEQLKLYQEAYRNLDISAQTVEDRVKELEKFKETLTPEQLENAKRLGLVRSRIKKKQDCEDGQHCQKIVSEAELAKFLEDGWKVSAVLPSGKIVIDNA